MRFHRIIAAACVVLSTALVTGCGKPDPQQTFVQAVLNVNLVHGFASPVLQGEFASPSVKLVDAKTGATAPMTRAEVLKIKLDAVEASYAKVKSLSASGDAQAMVEASRALYEYVLPVLRKEYGELAALYDSGAPHEKIAALEQAITEKHAARFGEMHRGLLEAAKTYAAAHDIKFNVTRTSPSRG